jgi:hypothetical protein
MPEPWRVTDQLLDAWLADAEVAPVAVAEMLKPLTINLVRNVVDARAQLAEAREELALYRSGEIVSKIAGDRIMSANKESHEGIREGIAKLGDSAKEALGKALGAISAATERAEAAERELAAVTADLEMQMENCQYCYAERQIRERAEAELATLRAQVETAQRLAMLVMGEAYDVEMGDADGHVGPSDEAVKLAMKFAAEMRAASTSTPEPPKETTTP